MNESEKKIRTFCRLEKSIRDKAKLIGGGDITAGIRLAITDHKIKKVWPNEKV